MLERGGGVGSWWESPATALLWKAAFSLCGLCLPPSSRLRNRPLEPPISEMVKVVSIWLEKQKKGGSVALGKDALRSEWRETNTEHHENDVLAPKQRSGRASDLMIVPLQHPRPSLFVVGLWENQNPASQPTSGTLFKSAGLTECAKRGMEFARMLGPALLPSVPSFPRLPAAEGRARHPTDARLID